MTATNAQIPAVGDQAPDFTLMSTSGSTVTLSAFRGVSDVLVAFFPLAFTGTCTSEMCAFTDDFDQFTEAGVQILPISVDARPSLDEYKRKYNMKVELLSDFKRDASRAFGVLNEEAFYAQRSYFLVDKEGIVRWVHVEAKSALRRENSEILAEIAKLQESGQV